MSVPNAGLPANCGSITYEELFLSVMDSSGPRIKSPSNPVTPEEKARAAVAAMQAQFRSQLSRLYVDRMRSEDSYQFQIRERDKKLADLEKKLEESDQKVEQLMAGLRIKNGELKSALEEVDRLKAGKVKVASPSGKF